MRKLLILFCLVTLSVYLPAQEPSLPELLEQLDRKQGKNKVQTLLKISSLQLAIDHTKAQEYGEQAFDLATRINDRAGKAKAHLAIGDALNKKLDKKRAMTAYVKALKIWDELDSPSGQATVRVRIGKIYSDTEDFVQAEEHLNKAIALATRIEDAFLHAQAQEALGDVYLKERIYGKSLEAYNAAVEHYMSANKITNAAAITYHLGNISTELGNQDGALAYYRTSLNLHKEAGDESNTALVNQSISLALLAQGDALAALEYNTQAQTTLKSLKDSVGMAACLKNFAMIYHALGKNEQAADNLQQSHQLLAQLNVSPKLPAVYEDIASTYSKLGDYKEAYNNHIAYAHSRKEYFNQEKANALLDLTTKYESEFEAREKQQQIELLEVENAQKKKVTYFLFVVVALIGMLLLSLFLSYRRKQKDNQILRKQNDEIKRQEEEITHKNVELETKNISLDLLNKKLLSEIAERENVEKSSFARDRFLATMSHEMRTPLNVITGLTHILLKETPRDDQVEHLRTLQFSANDLVVFINDVLDFSKIEAGKLNLADREFVPEKVIQDVQKRFIERADKHGLLFNYYYDYKIPGKLLGDDARLNQIMTNLLTNTFKHTKTGHVKVAVTLHELKARDAMLKVTVQGTDGGVDRRTIEEMFKPHRTGEDDFEGYDSQQFSLAITKRLVELQNGKIDVEVSPGDSTKFTVLLPFKLMMELPAEKKPVRREVDSLEGTHILVVEDNKINQLVVSKMLKRMGVTVTLANHGFEALEKVEITDFDLILMDIQMPEMDGYRATAEIRRHEKESKRAIPIIALTASAFLTEKEKAVLFGMNDHVGKPFSPDELMEKIKNCLATYKGA